MKRNIEALRARRFDLIVIGGGFFGAFAAWDAALRGLSVCLLERGDFCAETSANSYKIVHGGIRYLQHGDFVRMRRSSEERAAFLRIAPHLVHPREILIPTYGHGRKGKLFLRAGFGIYDLLTADLNRGIHDPSRRIPRTRSVSREKALRSFPGLDPNGLTGGVVFADGQMYHPPRLALAAIRAAAEVGAEVANRVEVTGLLRTRDVARGVSARDRMGGLDFEIEARMVLNATGPWAVDFLQKRAGIEVGANRRPSFSRDVGLVVRRSIDGSTGLASPAATRDSDAILDRGSRHLFILPWRDYTLVGVWHGHWSAGPESVEVTGREIEDFLVEANGAYPPLDLTPEDVLTVHTGLILYNEDVPSVSAHRFGRRSLIIDHEREDGVRGLATIVGVRATMARRVAEQVVDLTCQKLGVGRPGRTATTPLWGGDVDDFEALVESLELPDDGGPRVRRALAHNYGSGVEEVLRLCREDSRLAQTVGDSDVLAAEVVHAGRYEMALRLEDVVLRRTNLGVGTRPGRRTVETCADLLAEELGWSAEQRLAECQRVNALLTGRGTKGGEGAAGPILEVSS